MPRIIAVDYGAKRCGLAETDDLQIIASALEAVPTREIMDFLKVRISKYPVESIVVGLPVRMSGELSDIEEEIGKFIVSFRKNFPDIHVFRENESNTSKLAVQAMIQAGATKKTRREKGNIDKISATIILQQFLETKRNKQ
jgi:putative Holliday junction resolvase